MQVRALEYTRTLYHCSQFDLLPIMHVIPFKAFHNINLLIHAVHLFTTAGKTHLCCTNTETSKTTTASPTPELQDAAATRTSTHQVWIPPLCSAHLFSPFWKKEHRPSGSSIIHSCPTTTTNGCKKSTAAACQSQDLISEYQAQVPSK